MYIPILTQQTSRALCGLEKKYPAATAAEHKDGTAAATRDEKDRPTAGHVRHDVAPPAS
jgi:hypothetical protein